MKEDLLPFDIKQKNPSIIKVIGVGGGGSNAVKNMHRQGITGVDFIICNTDKQALESSAIETKIQLGPTLTEGLGAGSKANKGREAAVESMEEVRRQLDDSSKMVFITAGMGGGTGTGAAPVIASVAGELEKLTIGIVTIPFRFEGKRRIKQAIEGIHEMNKYVDALLVVNNEKIREIYGDLPADDAFLRADDVLTVAAKGIAEIITSEGKINVDFADVETVMSKSGIALMGSGRAGGEDRARQAVEQALASPLLDNNDIDGARKLLLSIGYSSTNPATMDEIVAINEHVQEAAGNEADLIFGIFEDNSLAEKIAVTIIATGFGEHDIPSIYSNMGAEPEFIIQPPVEEDEEFEFETSFESPFENDPDRPVKKRSVVDLDGDDEEESEEYANHSEDPFHLNNEIFREKNETEEQPEEKEPVFKIAKKKKPVNHQPEQYQQEHHLSNISEHITELENESAYKRRKLLLESKNKPEVDEYSRMTIRKNDDGKPRFRENNQFLHDNSD